MYYIYVYYNTSFSIINALVLYITNIVTDKDSWRMKYEGLVTPSVI